MIEGDTLLAKFGQKEHLEMLSNGTLYLNPISKYRNDTTYFRGDKNEGVIPINPQTIKLIDKDGNNLFDKIPRPSSVNSSYEGDDYLLMFCSSIIDIVIMKKKGNNIYELSDGYKNAMRDFGEYVLLFWKSEFLQLLKNAMKNSTPKFGFCYGPIIYRDLSDFSTDNYSKAYNATGSILDPYFVKGANYANQNEWRLLVDGSDASLPTRSDGSYTINIGKMQYSTLIDRETLYNKLTYEE
ncbi:hypothetical protein [Sedimentibacter saalensis]|uniref:Uncharacterized protein n=1 Tax=Sedimentibacter saalensis TaxID=130788 RepID=A0A562JHH7_9FIRM|nr:hypothetical protein [Sedimentibacter saalensis]TWH82561.1 hypothetical protein LY60_00862 [Sedimentibacter saalensis]